MGRDILSRVLYGSRVSLGVAIPSVALAVLAGTTLGVGLGYWGGAPDLLAMRVFDVLFAFPPILLAIALVAALGPSTVNLVLTIAVLTLPQFAVLARSATLALKPQDFVQAARALGASHRRILGGHVLPEPRAHPRGPDEPEPLDRHPGGGRAELPRARHRSRPRRAGAAC